MAPNPSVLQGGWQDGSVFRAKRWITFLSPVVGGEAKKRQSRHTRLTIKGTLHGRDCRGVVAFSPFKPLSIPKETRPACETLRYVPCSGAIGELALDSSHITGTASPHNTQHGNDTALSLLALPSTSGVYSKLPLFTYPLSPIEHSSCPSPTTSSKLYRSQDVNCSRNENPQIISQDVARNVAV